MIFGFKWRPENRIAAVVVKIETDFPRVRSPRRQEFKAAERQTSLEVDGDQAAPATPAGHRRHWDARSENRGRPERFWQ